MNLVFVDKNEPDLDCSNKNHLDKALYNTAETIVTDILQENDVVPKSGDDEAIKFVQSRLFRGISVDHGAAILMVDDGELEGFLTYVKHYKLRNPVAQVQIQHLWVKPTLRLKRKSTLLCQALFHRYSNKEVSFSLRAEPTSKDYWGKLEFRPLERFNQKIYMVRDGRVPSTNQCASFEFCREDQNTVISASS